MSKVCRTFLPLLVVMLLALSAVLAACGDSATSTPASGGTAQTTQAVVTAPASIPTAAFSSGTTAAATTAAASSAATTASATTAAATSVAATTAAATTSASTTGTAKKGGSVTLVTTLEAKTMHPYNCVDVYCAAYIGRVYGGYAGGGGFLVSRDPKSLQVVGLFAKSWNVDKDNKTVTYTLKDNLKWSDGKPITTDDFIWTYQQAIKKENNWPRYAQYIADPSKPDQNGVIGYEAPDPQTLKVKLNTLTFDIVERGDIITPLPRHIWEGKDWNDPTKNPEIDNPSVVSGPWKMKSWDKGKSWTVVRNDASSVWPAPNLDQLTVVTVENASIGFQKIKSGEADAFQGTMGFATQDVAEASTLSNATVYKWTSAQAQWQHIAFNFRKPYMKDLALRQALTWVIDRKAISDKVYFGLAVPMYSDVAPSSDKYDDKAVEKYGYDPDKAKKILTDAKYTIKDGKLYDPSGQPIPKLKFVYSSNGAEAAKIAAIAQQEWKDLGIDLDLIGVDFNTVLKTIQQPPFDFDMVTLGWSAGINPENFGDVWKTIPNLNFGDWENKQVNDLYSSTQREFDASKRKETMSQIQSIESRDGPYIYLVAQTSFAVVNNRVGGVEATPLGIGIDNIINNYATSWYIK